MQRLKGCPLGTLEFPVAGFPLFNTLNVGAEFVSAFYKLFFLCVLFSGIECVHIFRSHFLGKQGQQAHVGVLFDVLIGRPDLPVEILHRCGHITGQDLGHIVEQADHSGMVRIQFLSKALIADHTQCLCDHGNLQRMFREVLVGRISHERPAVDPFQARHHRKKGVVSHLFFSVLQLFAMEMVPVLCTSSMPKLLSSSRNSATTSGVLWISIMIDFAETFMIFAPMTLHSSIRDDRFCTV